MTRRVLFALTALAFGFTLVGCGGGDNQPTNPNNLEYSKEPPPKREGPPGEKKK
jgi:ABC-type uncharacterized transport system auxiliary subunit